MGISLALSVQRAPFEAARDAASRSLAGDHGDERA
jgi:hypothetical protein